MDPMNEFAEFVLQLLEDTADWSSDTTDEIGEKAFTLGLAKLGDEHQFKRVATGRDCSSTKGQP